MGQSEGWKASYAPSPIPCPPPVPLRTTCRVCGSRKLTELFSLGEQYVSDFVAKKDVHSGRKVPITLQLCRGCTLVQLAHTAPQDFLYTRHYWYKSGTTATMRAALADVVRAAVETVRLERGDVVLDIGSNDGTLLRAYDDLRLGFHVRKIGVEPATNFAEEGSRGGIELVNDFWGLEAYNRVTDGKKAKIITACGMFYDLEDPNQFIADVAAALHPDGVFVAQLMCLKQTVEQNDVGNLCHEHLEYYSLRSLQHLYARHSMEIIDVEENGVNGGSYRVFAKLNRSSLLPREGATLRMLQAVRNELDMKLDSYYTYADMWVGWRENRDACYDHVVRDLVDGKPTWVYGASTKGNVILQWYGLDRRMIVKAADKSPEKWGRYTVGTGIQIVSEEEFREAAPANALILPYSFLQEFVKREDAWLAGGGKFLVPLPKFRVVGGDKA